MIDLIEAIESKRLISFTYKKTNRIAEVYTLGLSATGELLVRCYEKPKGWKLFKADQMSNIKLLNQRFYFPRSGYNRNCDKNMVEILVKV